MDLGDPVIENVRNDATVKTIKLLEDDFFWGGYCHGIGIGGTGARDSFMFQDTSEYSTEVNNSLYSILDTGATSIMISSLYYESFIHELFDRTPGSIEWEFRDGLVYTECQRDYPMLYFLFDNNWIEVSPDSYVTPVASDSSTCIFFLMPASLPMNIIGMPAFIDYYTMHDPETGSIDFAPHTVSSKQSL